MIVGLWKRSTRAVLRYALRTGLEYGVITRSLVLGALVGFSPTVGLQIVLILIVAFFCRILKLSKFDVFVASIASMVVNPLNFVPVYGLYYLIGCAVVDCSLEVDFAAIDNMFDFIELGGSVAEAIAIGSIPFVIVGSTGAAWLGIVIEKILHARFEKRRQMNGQGNGRGNGK